MPVPCMTLQTVDDREVLHACAKANSYPGFLPKVFQLSNWHPEFLIRIFYYSTYPGFLPKVFKLSS